MKIPPDLFHTAYQTVKSSIDCMDKCDTVNKFLNKDLEQMLNLDFSNLTDADMAYLYLISQNKDLGKDLFNISSSTTGFLTPQERDLYNKTVELVELRAKLYTKIESFIGSNEELFLQKYKEANGITDMTFDANGKVSSISYACKPIYGDRHGNELTFPPEFYQPPYLHTYTVSAPFPDHTNIFTSLPIYQEIPHALSTINWSGAKAMTYYPPAISSPEEFITKELKSLSENFLGSELKNDIARLKELMNKKN